nr:hypothetical protein [Bacilli bacterium]
TLASAGITLYKELLMFKDVADSGYLIDMKKMKDLDDKIKDETKSSTLSWIFFPFLGILFSLANLTKYYQFRNQLLNQLNFFDMLRRMPNELYQEYAKKPTLLNALLTALKAESEIQYISIPDKTTGSSSKIRYQFSGDFSDIEIIEIEGPAANLTYREQQELIKNAWIEIGKEVSYEYGTLDNFDAACENGKTIELDDSPIDEIPAEEVQISSIKLCKIDEENSYFEVELIDEFGKKVGVFGSPYITDSVNFRREVFGILLASGINDFLKLGGVEEPTIPITFKCNSRNVVASIHNSKGETFHLNGEGIYKTEPTIQDNQEISFGNVTGIISEINALNMTIENEHFHTHYPTGNLYYGFGYPLISSSSNPELIAHACNHYKEYIENILDFLGTDDLLRMAGEPIKFPKVLIERDSTGNIIAIGQKEQECHLRITDNNYKIEKGKLVVDKNKSKKLI